jgi:hypothetical protein
MMYLIGISRQRELPEIPRFAIQLTNNEPKGEKVFGVGVETQEEVEYRSKHQCLDSVHHGIHL